MAHDTIKWHPVVEVIKYDPDTVKDIMRTYGLETEPTAAMLADLQENHGLQPDKITVAQGNSLVNTGKQRLSDLFTGAGQAFTTTRGMAGVGDSSANPGVVTQTTLQAVTNTWYRAIDAAPLSATGVITAASTFGTSDGNYVWNEWCWCIATAAPVSSATFNTATTTGIMVNRAVQNLGTKVSGAIWTLNGTVTQS